MTPRLDDDIGQRFRRAEVALILHGGEMRRRIIEESILDKKSLLPSRRRHQGAGLQSIAALHRKVQRAPAARGVDAKDAKMAIVLKMRAPSRWTMRPVRSAALGVSGERRVRLDRSGGLVS